jgi:hypothetical protein
MDALRASNRAAVNRALGFQTRALTDLPTMRNFFAHKGDTAAKKARELRFRYGITRVVAPPELLCQAAPGRPQPIICDWLDDLHTVIDLTN